MTEKTKKFITTGMVIHTYTVILFSADAQQYKKQSDSTHLLTKIGLPALQNKTPYVRQLSLL